MLSRVLVLCSFHFSHYYLWGGQTCTKCTFSLKRMFKPVHYFLGKGSPGWWLKCPLSSFGASLQQTSPVDGSTLGRAAPGPRGGRFVSWASKTSCHQARLLSSEEGEAGRSKRPPRSSLPDFWNNIRWLLNCLSTSSSLIAMLLSNQLA